MEDAVEGNPTSGIASASLVESDNMAISFFSRKPKEVPPDPFAEVPQPLQVAYDPGLVTALTRQHRDLALLLDKAKESVQNKRYEDVKAMLDKLRTEIASHMQRETDELHAYLTAQIKSADRLATLKDMHAGALRTGRAVEGFLKHYGGYPVNERNAGMFYKEIDGVSAEFKKWIAQEEASVYALYKSPETY
jgi:hypothetical protein